MKSIRIGILGGIGPEATGQYYLKLVRDLQRTGLITENTDFPQIIINSIPAPELIGTISQELLEPYKTGLRQLDEFGVDVIVMVCNTIHLYHKELQSVVRAHIIDLRQKVKEKMIREGVKKVTILGTPSTIRRGLYKFDGIDYIDILDQEIDDLSAAIFRYNKGENKIVQEKLVEKIARKYLDRGAETIVLGCTEFAVMLDGVNIPKIDTSDVLVEETIGFYRRTERRVSKLN